MMLLWMMEGRVEGDGGREEREGGGGESVRREREVLVVVSREKEVMVRREREVVVSERFREERERGVMVRREREVVVKSDGTKGAENYLDWKRRLDRISEHKDIYLRFYKALRKNYPDIRIISNCDVINQQDDPRVFVSEYVVTQPSDKVGNGTFKSALAEAALLLSLEENSDVAEIISYAPFFLNVNDRTWYPDAIFFNSNKAYGIASYWVQTCFKQSSGATLLNVHFHNHSKPENTYVTAISWTDERDKTDYITIKAVNFNNVTSNLKISIDGIDNGSIKLWKKTVLAYDDLNVENSFDNAIKVVPITI
ncbi:Alpha-L-arabinofuranosidase 1 [Bienertia sinuspersici]